TVVACGVCFFFFQAEDGIRDRNVTGVQTCALPISGEWVGVSGPGGRWGAGQGSVTERARAPWRARPGSVARRAAPFLRYRPAADVIGGNGSACRGRAGSWVPSREPRRTAAPHCAERFRRPSRPTGWWRGMLADVRYAEL